MKNISNLKKYYKPIGSYRYYTLCRFCGSDLLEKVLDLGPMPLAGGFIDYRNIRTIEKREYYYPLELGFCKNCFLLQTICVIEANTLFKNYYYFSSKINTLVKFFNEVADEIKVIVGNSQKKLVVEIGSNDGAFLTAIAQRGLRRVGVDPAENIVSPLIKNNIPVINDYFNINTANTIIKTYGKADIVASFNTLAHIENIHEVLFGIKKLLKPSGILLFQTHYLKSLIKNYQYDMIYHEHQYYYSLMTLQKLFVQYDMEIYNVKLLTLHGGSMMYYVKHKSNKQISIQKSIYQVLKKEKELKFHHVETYKKYQKAIHDSKKKLQQVILSIQKKKKTIAGYGASGRGTIVSNYCIITKDQMPYVIDDSPKKQGAYMPGTHQKIISSEILYAVNRPDYVILFAWSFFDEIVKKHKKYIEAGGKFIVPFPRVKIIDKSSL